MKRASLSLKEGALQVQYMQQWSEILENWSAGYLYGRSGTGAVIHLFLRRRGKDGLAGHAGNVGASSLANNIHEVHAGQKTQMKTASPYSFAQLKEDSDSLSGGDELHTCGIHAAYGSSARTLGLSAYGLLRLWAHLTGLLSNFRTCLVECHQYRCHCGLGTSHFTINDDALAYYDGHRLSSIRSRPGS